MKKLKLILVLVYVLIVAHFAYAMAVNSHGFQLQLHDATYHERNSKPGTPACYNLDDSQIDCSHSCPADLDLDVGDNMDLTDVRTYRGFPFRTNDYYDNGCPDPEQRPASEFKWAYALDVSYFAGVTVIFGLLLRKLRK